MYQKLKIVFIAKLAMFFALSNIYAEQSDIKDIPSVVTRTFPVAGSTMVDPSRTKIHVTFSQLMVDKSWSFVMQDKATFPELVGAPSFDPELRTCTLNVKLEPNKTYIIWINSAKLANFKGENGKPSLPYMLSFKTAGKELEVSKKTAIASAESWLKLLNDAKFAESWTEAAPYFQKKVKKEKWVKEISFIYSKTGKVQSRKLISATYTKTLPQAPKGEYFIIRFATSFENSPKTVETIVPMRVDDGWKISGYFIK